MKTLAKAIDAVHWAIKAPRRAIEALRRLISSKGMLLKYGLRGIAGGIVILVLVVVVEQFHPSSHIMIASLSFLDHLGVAFFSIGVIGILLENPEWRDYYEQRIVATIIRRDYLSQFRTGELRKILATILEARYEVDNIDREGSVFDFFDKKIQTFAALPYREDTRINMIVSLSQDGQRCVVKERITYKCRKIGACIQDEIKWIAEHDEMEKLDSFRIKLEVPQVVFQSEDFRRLNLDANRIRMFDKNDAADSAKAIQLGTQGKPALTAYKPGEGHGYILNLGSYKTIDELLVTSYAGYTVRAGRALPWTMPHPSNNLKGKIRYPEELKIYVDLFGIDESELKTDPKNRKGVYKFSYNNWVLPDNGLSFDFIKETNSQTKL